MSSRTPSSLTAAAGVAFALALPLISTPLWAQAPGAPPTPAELEAARHTAPVVDDAAAPVDPSAFVAMSPGPAVGEPGQRAVVDLRTVSRSTVPPELVEQPRFHRQGSHDAWDTGISSTGAPLSPERTEAETPGVDATFDHPTEDVRGSVGTLVTRWDGQGFSGWIPPDTQLAVGPEYILEAVNSGFSVYTKTGTQTTAYTNFETFVNLPSPWDGFCYDPRVVYSQEHGKFLMMIMGKDETNLTSYFWLMVSQTSNPNGQWWTWRFNASAGASGSEEWLDYAAIGVDHWGVYVTGNYFRYGGGFQRVQLWSMGPQLFEGTSTSTYYWSDLEWPNGDNAFTVQPALAHSQHSGGNTFYVNTYRSSGNQVCLWTQSGKRYPADPNPDAAALNRVAISSKQYYAMGNNVDQPGSAWDIDAGDARVMNAVYNQGRIYGTLALNWDGNLAYCEVYLFVLTTAGAMDWDRAVWNASYNFTYPAVTVQGTATAPDVYLSFSITEPGSATGYIGASSYYYDPTGNTGFFLVERWGDGPYSRWDGDFVGDGRNRWGDYSGAAWDWTCNNAWGAAEYATSSNTWATRIMARTLGTHDPCQYFHVATPNGGQTYTAGTTQTATWERMNIPSGDEIHLWLWDGGTWRFLAGPLASTSTSRTWQVPNIPTTGARIFVGSQPSGGGDWKVSDQSDGTFTINALPDLEYLSFSPPSSAEAGDSFTVYNAVRNSGPVSSGGFNVEIRLSTNTICSTSDTLLATRSVPSLAASLTSSAFTGVTIPPSATVGTSYLCLMVDAGGTVPEFSESNNTTFAAITILEGPFFEDGFESGNTSAWSSTTP